MNGAQKWKWKFILALRHLLISILQSTGELLCDGICDPDLEGGPDLNDWKSKDRHSIREMCKVCGKRGKWQKVLL